MDLNPDPKTSLRSPELPGNSAERFLSIRQVTSALAAPLSAEDCAIHSGPDFCFDNVTPRHRVWLDAFQIASHPVTYGDFMEFIQDGGYRRPELWLSAGWDAVTTRGWQAPLYWESRDGPRCSFTLHGEVLVDPHTPICHVSFYEADAYARWANQRLPTEAEWEVAASSGSCATPCSHIRASYRNFFPPDARWQFSGLRLARDAE